MPAGVTKSGFAYDVDKQRLDNMELIDALAEVEDNPLVVSKITTMLLGKAQKARLYNHVRTEDGRVPVEAMNQELSDIMNGMGQTGKN